MNDPQLLVSSGDATADNIVRGLVGIFEAVFPDRVAGYYLTGSYANGSALPTSDLDMAILFKGRFLSQAEFETAVQINESCKLISPVVLDAWVISDERTQQAEFIGDTLELKLSSRLVYGKDTRHMITAQPDATYVRWAMDIPQYPLTVARNLGGSVTVPLDYPDPDGMFYGYDQWKVRTAYGKQQAGTKLLVALVGRIASALIAHHAGQYVGSKQECVEKYRMYINDEWTTLVEQVYEHCRNRWGYCIPVAEEERQRLRTFCQQTLAFENHFLTVYKSFLLAELQSGERKHQLLAIKRLGQIIYPAQDVVAVLSALTAGHEIEVSAAAEDALRQIAVALR